MTVKTERQERTEGGVVIQQFATPPTNHWVSTRSFPRTRRDRRGQTSQDRGQSRAKQRGIHVVHHKVYDLRRGRKKHAMSEHAHQMHRGLEAPSATFRKQAALFELWSQPRTNAARRSPLSHPSPLGPRNRWPRGMHSLGTCVLFTPTTHPQQTCKRRAADVRGSIHAHTYLAWREKHPIESRKPLRED